MKQWYYKLDGVEKGPVTLDELKGMLHRGDIDPKTLVKGPNVVDWTHLDELEIFEAPLDVRGEGDVPLEENRTNEEAPKSRPWMRFVGRMFDYSWFGLVLGWILSAFGLTIEEAPFGLLLVPFLWIFGETFFMSTWGMTPGKWMTQTYVRLKDNQKLTLKDALYRSLSVWWLGLAAGIPIVSFITMIVACVKLSNTGKTTWDRSGKFIVWHRRIGPFRITFLIIFFLAFFWSVAPFIINVN